MEYKIIGGSHIAYFDNTAKDLRPADPGSKTPAITTSKTANFDDLLKKAEQRNVDKASNIQSSPSTAIPSPPATALPSPAMPKNSFPPVALERNPSSLGPSQEAAPPKRARSAERSHIVKAGDTVWELAVKVYHIDPDEILKLNNISDPRRLQIGQVLRIPGKLQSTGKEDVVASWYGAEHHGRPMANGDPFNMYGATIAHKELPLGTRVLLENPATGERVTATVTDRGPYIEGRDVDLSFRLAQRLSLDIQGVGPLTMEIL